jgi:L-threonylcarbamoyladenylate synthase
MELVHTLAPFWPGPLTLILPRHPRIPDIVTAGLDTVGVRIPAHPVALELLRLCDFPVAAPSANPSNYVSPTRAEHVERELGASLAMILDGGPCQAGVESTILSLVEEPPRILRTGALPVEELADRLRIPVDTLLRGVSPENVAPAVDASPRPASAPGQLPEHYAPRTPLVFTHEVAAHSLPSRVGRIIFRKSSPLVAEATDVVCLSDDGDFADIARGLFAALRELDQRDLDLLIVDTCDEVGLGRAIMDRLRRARHGTRVARPAAAATET